MDWEKIVPGCILRGKQAEDLHIQGAATLDCLPALFQNVINAAFTLGGTVAVIIIIWSGMKYLLSQGDPKKVQDAQTTMTYAIIGLVLILASAFIINVVSNVLSIPCIQTVGFENCK